MHTRPMLLVEDNLDDQALAIRAIRRSGITLPVLIASDGVEAMAHLQPGEHSQPGECWKAPLFVLLDLHLPKLDGLEVLRRIRANARTAHLPVIILTSSREDRDRSESYRLGANSYVCKPVDFTQFVTLFQQLVTYWSQINEQPPELTA